jgi:hypothetical protein
MGITLSSFSPAKEMRKGSSPSMRFRLEARTIPTSRWGNLDAKQMITIMHWR